MSSRLSLLLFSTALFCATAQADIIYSPQSIVQSQDGTYITDTVNNRDWYKFSNTLNTVGLSMNQVNNFIAGSNWSVASRAQVQGLQGQFGWTADTLSSSLNANFGLTTVMGNYLGITANYFNPDDQFPETGQMIQAMTSDAGFVLDDQGEILNEYRFTTMSMTSAYLNVPGGGFFFGDYVKGEYRFLEVSETDRSIGTWLSRVHVTDTGGGGGIDPDCGRLAPCLPSDVPEPASYALVGIALMGLCFNQSRRSIRS